MERRTAKLLGFDIDTFSYTEALAYTRRLVDSAESSHIVTINPEIIEYSNTHPEFAKILQEAELVLPDGIGIKIGLMIKNNITVKRIAGVEFAKSLVAGAAYNNIPIGMIGAKPHVIEKAIANLQDEYPELNIVYSHDGYFQDNKQIIEEVKNKAPRMLLVAMGSPKQEELIYELKSVLNSTVMIGIGGSFDVWAGEVQRAPKAWQKMGLEWLYRAIKQPERFKRIFPTLPIFVYNVIKEKYLKKEVY